MALAELDCDPGQLWDKPAHPIPQRGICCDPTVLQEECICSHPACHKLKTRSLWNETWDVLLSRQGRHIEVGERMPHTISRRLAAASLMQNKTTSHSYSALTHLQAPTGIQATSKVLENGIKMPGHQTLALVINQVLNGKIIFSRHILVVATACSLHCFVISLLFSDSFKMSLLWVFLQSWRQICLLDVYFRVEHRV